MIKFLLKCKKPKTITIIKVKLRTMTKTFQATILFILREISGTRQRLSQIQK